MSQDPKDSSTQDAQALLKRLRGKRGYLLPFHEMMARNLPDALGAYDDFYSSLWFKEHHLTPRERELVAIGIHTAVLEREGLRIHLERALAAGATQAEITEAMTLCAIPAGMYSVLVASEIWAEYFSSSDDGPDTDSTDELDE